MIQNIFKVIFPVSIIVVLLNILTVVVSIFPKYLSWISSISKVSNLIYLDKISPIFTSLFLLSIGYYLVKEVYNKSIEGYDEARHLLMSSIFAMPFIPAIFSAGMLYPYITGKAFAFRFLSIVGFSAFIYLLFTNKNFRAKVTPITASVTLFTLLIGVSNLLGSNFFKSFWGNFERMDGYLTLITVWMFVVSLTSVRLKDFEWLKLGKIHVAVASFVTGIGASQYIFGLFKFTSVAGLPILGHCVPLATQGLATYCKVDSTLGNPIYLGIYAGLTSWIILYYIVKRNWQVNAWVWFTFALNLITPIVLTTTRGVWVAIAAGIFVSAIIYFTLNKNKRAITLLSIASIIVLVLVFVFTYFSDRAFVQNISFFGRLFNINTLFARWNVWQIALNSFVENPIFGWGQESFINAFNKNYNPAMYGQEVYFDHPHNAYIGWLFVGGILGFTAYLSTLFAGVYSSIKSYFKNQSEDKNGLTFAIVMGAIVTYLIYSIFMFDNLVTTLLVMFMFVYFGRNFSYGSLVIAEISQSSKKVFAYVLSLITIAVLFFSFWKPIYANKTLIDAMTYQNKAVTPIDAISGTRALFEKGLNLNTFANYEILEQYLQRSLVYESIARQTKDQQIIDAVSAFKNSAVNNFTSHINNNPEDHRARFVLGLYYTSLSDFENAKKYLTEAYNLAQNKQVSMIALAKVLLIKGEKEEAFKLYQKALDVTPKPTSLTPILFTQYNDLRIEYVKALMLDGKDQDALKIIQEMLPVSSVNDFQKLVNSMMQIYAVRKDIKGIVTLLSDAIKLDPTNANFYIWLGQALVYVGDYNGAVQVVSALNSQYPQVVAEFIRQVQELVNQKKN